MFHHVAKGIDFGLGGFVGLTDWLDDELDLRFLKHFRKTQVLCILAVDIAFYYLQDLLETFEALLAFFIGVRRRGCLHAVDGAGEAVDDNLGDVNCGSEG